MCAPSETPPTSRSRSPYAAAAASSARNAAPTRSAPGAGGGATSSYPACRSGPANALATKPVEDPAPGSTTAT